MNQGTKDTHWIIRWQGLKQQQQRLDPFSKCKCACKYDFLSRIGRTYLNYFQFYTLSKAVEDLLYFWGVKKGQGYLMNLFLAFFNHMLRLNNYQVLVILFRRQDDIPAPNYLRWSSCFEKLHFRQANPSHSFMWAQILTNALDSTPSFIAFFSALHFCLTTFQLVSFHNFVVGGVFLCS